MEKYFKLIHLKDLSRKTIFDAYINLPKSKIYKYNEPSRSLFKSDFFWKTVKNYCINSNINFIESNIIPPKYKNFILVDIKQNNAHDSEPLDYNGIQFFLAFLFQLKNNYIVCFYNSDLNESKNQSNYFRLSIYLNLWLAQSNNIDNFLFLNLEKETHKRLAFKYSYDEPSITVLPLVSLDKNMYLRLDKPYNKNKACESLNELLKNIKKSVNKKCIYQYYEDFLYQAINKLLSDSYMDLEWKKKETDFIDSNPPLIVMYLYSIIKHYIDETDVQYFSVESLVEKSYDYAHGLLQLIENSIKHVTMKHKNSCAFFSVIMHHKKGAMNKYINNGYYNELKYYLELSVLDCTDALDYCGITEKYSKTLKELDIDPISSLSEIFVHPNPPSLSLDKFYSNASNIANHYGLQIFDTILTSNNGLFIVQSGITSKAEIYTNANKIYYKGDLVYKNCKEDTSLSAEHFKGTHYTIILPIDRNKKKYISSDISLSNIPLLLDNNFKPAKTYKLEPIPTKGGTKEAAVEKYKELVIEKIKSDNNGIISLDVQEISKSRYKLELLCKAIISIISNEEGNNRMIICLLNIQDEHKLLDALRIIALFFDKTGHCNFVKNKGIYLSTVNNQYDILFTGNNIKSVIENIDRQRLLQSLPEHFYTHILFALKDRIEEDKT